MLESEDREVQQLENMLRISYSGILGDERIWRGGGKILESAVPTIFRPREDSNERSLRISNKDDQNSRGNAARRHRSRTLGC